MPTNESAVEADPLFNNPKADVILRSSDNVDFRTFKVLLSLASPVFEDMFNLPQPPDPNGDDKDDMSVVPISEPSRLVEMWLKMFHPKCSLLLDNMDDIGYVMEISKKYDMEGVAERTRERAEWMLTQVEEDDPIRAYALACRFHFADEATRAARRSLKLSISEILDRTQVTELKHITGAQLQSLYNYHRKCGKAASALASTPAWIPPHHSMPVVWFNGGHCSSIHSPLSNGSSYNPSIWWVDYMRDSGFELESRPHAITVTKSELLNKALKKASACGVCRDKAFDQMTKFLEVYVASVETVLAEVKIDLVL